MRLLKSCGVFRDHSRRHSLESDNTADDITAIQSASLWFHPLLATASQLTHWWLTTTAWIYLDIFYHTLQYYTNITQPQYKKCNFLKHCHLSQDHIHHHLLCLHHHSFIYFLTSQQSYHCRDVVAVTSWLWGSDFTCCCGVSFSCVLSIVTTLNNMALTLYTATPSQETLHNLD